MFRKLHIQMTVFSTLITSAILIAMTLICLFIAESGARKNNYAAFQESADSCIIHLESETILSHQWLLQAQNTYGIHLQIRDNGKRLYFDRLHPATELEDIFREAEEISRKSYALDLNTVRKNTALTRSVLFTMKDYYACTALIPKHTGSLSMILLCPLEPLNRQLRSQRLAFAAAVFFSILALAVFSWFFTRKMIRPLEENRRAQTEFIASASHELRSPLTVIQSGISSLEHALFQTEAEDDSGEAVLNSPDSSSLTEIQYFFSVISREGTRMARLIDDMLTLANADNHTWELSMAPCELDTLLLETYDAFLLPAREKGIKLSVRLPEEGLPSCLCDSSRISQVLSILLDNALSCVPEKFRSPGGGESQPLPDNVPDRVPEKGMISLALASERGHFVLSVSDNGPGIPDDRKEAVFRRFYRLDSSRTDKQHFGLGLSIAREIISLHHGTLTVTDTPGGGATFLITLPQ